ncbi:MAG TPA: hypothetical protein VGD40_05260 [Chryseosolibacter sp.]
MKTTGRLAIALYKPRAGKAEDLRTILKDHISTLRQYELITDAGSFTALCEDGTVMEIFEWTHEEAKNHAHEHPAIRTIWGRMEGVCDFPPLKDLNEAKHPFANFQVIAKE